ncbi:hypothetical protein OPKNFCMD_0754 [Methylobacterium crusticola]|uniref:Uncharacterized protein n=1 Tax=Methylobacterium crusticola TaxID=1697972 RepID=A0ABQ4QSW2_9HYPH|nr:hypothetical protein [Methylobacterium crusticola]GJD48039.1 hypothetical protein OPKNFCMD_0754 [Methylobacterium crusticola]
MDGFGRSLGRTIPARTIPARTIPARTIPARTLGALAALVLAAAPALAREAAGRVVGPLVPGAPGYDCRLPTPFDHDAAGRRGEGPPAYGYGTGGASASGAVTAPPGSVAACDLGALTLGRRGLDILPP